ncbi:Lsr2 family protein [Rhodococcus aetherivorans]|uniref:histone-like nucleoid-structuring protein Lsr2 n=1 Tax=Rhodococcus aetherivorans TaxID=191292 RepID=UPI00369DC49A
MARKTIVETFDDIDGTALEVDGETISFALDGVKYTIDLSKKNARDFRKKINYYVEHATRVGGRKRRGGVRQASGSPSSKEIREWAVKAGYEVPARGRLPRSLVEQYTTSH